VRSHGTSPVIRKRDFTDRCPYPQHPPAANSSRLDRPCCALPRPLYYDLCKNTVKIRKTNSADITPHTARTVANAGLYGNPSRPAYDPYGPTAPALSPVGTLPSCQATMGTEFVEDLHASWPHTMINSG
jgi:hypothetical protein